MPNRTEKPTHQKSKPFIANCENGWQTSVQNEKKYIGTRNISPEIVFNTVHNFDYKKNNIPFPVLGVFFYIFRLKHFAWTIFSIGRSFSFPFVIYKNELLKHPTYWLLIMMIIWWIHPIDEFNVIYQFINEICNNLAKMGLQQLNKLANNTSFFSLNSKSSFIADKSAPLKAKFFGSIFLLLVLDQ